MDFTETYIKMSKHPKIQEQWDPKIMDIIFIDNSTITWSAIEASNASSVVKGNYFRAIKDGGNFCVIISDGIPNYLKKLVCWLPFQYQIQKMRFGDRVRADAIVSALNDWREENYDYQLNLISMEQFCLAFYMYEKHDLIWDSDKWVPVNRLAFNGDEWVNKQLKNRQEK